MLAVAAERARVEALLPVTEPAPAAPVAVAKVAWLEARAGLKRTLGTIRATYNRLDVNWSDVGYKLRWHVPYNSPDYIHDGDILHGLDGLFQYIQREKKFEKAEDTYECCMTLHYCTKYLACDNEYKREGYRSRADNFSDIYEKNYKFRRNWVAFLRQIVTYVEMIYEDEDEKLYQSVDKLKVMHSYESFWEGRQWYVTDRPGVYDWSTVIGHITTAQAEIDREPPQEPWFGRKPDADGGRRETTALLEQLRELSV